GQAAERVTQALPVCDMASFAFGSELLGFVADAEKPTDFVVAVVDVAVLAFRRIAPAAQGLVVRDVVLAPANPWLHVVDVERAGGQLRLATRTVAAGHEPDGVADTQVAC